MSEEKRRERLEKGLSMPFIEKLLKSKPSQIADMEFRPVRTINELQTSAHLVYQEYLKSEYIVPNKNEWKVTLHQALPSTVTFIALMKKTHILGTLTVVEDSPLGLPMDNLYKSELDNLRLDDQRLAEISMLALNKDVLESEDNKVPMGVRLWLLIYLFKAMFEYLRTSTHVDNLVACFHPKHEIMYKFLQLEPLGSLKHHPKVQGSPALARHMNIKATRQNAKGHALYDLFFGSMVPGNLFHDRLKYTLDDMQELFVEHSNILASATPEKLKHIQKCYPHIDMHALIKQKSIFDHIIDSLSQNKPNDPGNNQTNR